MFLCLRTDSAVHCSSLITPPDSIDVALLRTPMQGFLTPAEENSSTDSQSVGEAVVQKGCESCSGQGSRASLALEPRGQVPALSLPISLLSSFMQTTCLLPSSMLGSMPCTPPSGSVVFSAFELLPHHQLVQVNTSKCFISHLQAKHGQCSHTPQIVQETEPRAGPTPV